MATHVRLLAGMHAHMGLHVALFGGHARAVGVRTGVHVACAACGIHGTFEGRLVVDDGMQIVVLRGSIIGGGGEFGVTGSEFEIRGGREEGMKRGEGDICGGGGIVRCGCGRGRGRGWGMSGGVGGTGGGVEMRMGGCEGGGGGMVGG